MHREYYEPQYAQRERTLFAGRRRASPPTNTRLSQIGLAVRFTQTAKQIK